MQSLMAQCERYEQIVHSEVWDVLDCKHVVHV